MGSYTGRSDHVESFGRRDCSGFTEHRNGDPDPHARSRKAVSRATYFWRVKGPRWSAARWAQDSSPRVVGASFTITASVPRCRASTQRGRGMDAVPPVEFFKTHGRAVPGLSIKCSKQTSRASVSVDAESGTAWNWHLVRPRVGNEIPTSTTAWRRSVDNVADCRRRTETCTSSQPPPCTGPTHCHQRAGNRLAAVHVRLDRHGQSADSGLRHRRGR